MEKVLISYKPAQGTKTQVMDSLLFVLQAFSSRVGEAYENGEISRETLVRYTDMLKAWVGINASFLQTLYEN